MAATEAPQTQVPRSPEAQRPLLSRSEASDLARQLLEELEHQPEPESEPEPEGRSERRRQSSRSRSSSHSSYSPRPARSRSRQRSRGRSRRSRVHDASDEVSEYSQPHSSSARHRELVLPDTHGCLFVCTDSTRKECFERALAAGPYRVHSAADNLRRGVDLIVLYDLKKRSLYGPFRAAQSSWCTVDSDAFADVKTKEAPAKSKHQSPFPVQVPFWLIWDGVYEISDESVLKGALPRSRDTQFGPIYENLIPNWKVDELIDAFKKHGKLCSWLNDLCKAVQSEHSNVDPPSSERAKDSQPAKPQKRRSSSPSRRKRSLRATTR